MQQPTLAPAPHSHTSLQDTASSAEQTLRAHLLPHISPSQNTTAGTAPPSSGTAVGSDIPREVNPNIDPAISGVGVGSQQQAQQQQLPQQQQPILQQPIQQQPVQHAIQQQVPQQMQQMQQMQHQHQHPQSPGVQNMQMASPVMSQGMTLDQQHSQSQSGAEESEQPKARGGKRELSTSKRAAQNRAAQRAFRQRKEGYIKKLEEQVRDFTAMQESYKQIQSENYQLRDYIINIQSRLIESQGEDAVPPPPPVFLHPAPPLMLLDTSQTTGTPQPTQPSQQVSQGQVQLPGAPAPAMQAQSVLQ
ncbi:hypothetical protein BDD12DRAFT_204852 [Trichophaea hybrida]|nr:hypothetical protein BDD12DRAFT_204852 [Trichophaea hybrida]